MPFLMTSQVIASRPLKAVEVQYGSFAFFMVSFLERPVFLGLVAFVRTAQRTS